MTVRDDISLVQHPIARILELIGELKDSTTSKLEYDQKDIDELWYVLENLIVMVATQDDRADTAYKAMVYDQITGMIRAATIRIKEKPDADSHEESGRGAGDWGSNQSGGPRDKTRSSPTGDQGS